MKLPATITSSLEAWLRENTNGKIPAIVLGSSINGLSFVRSLGRREIPVLLLDNQQLLGSYSRYARFVRLNSLETYEALWLDLLEWLGQHLSEKAALFPIFDAHCLFVSKHQEQLQTLFRLIVPPMETVEKILNKRLQYTIAQSAGIPIPQTYFPTTLDDGNELLQTLTYPCLLKPYTSYLGRKAISNQKVQIVNSKAELVPIFERLNTQHAPFMIQEIIPGDDSALYGYLSLWDGQGNELAWASKRKLRQYPPGFGDGSLQVTVDLPEVVELGRRLIKAFDYQGFVSVEFKFDARDSTYRLMEINPRTVSGNQLAISAGVDFPWIGYQHLLNQPLPAVTFQPGVKHVNEEWDFQSFLAMRKHGTLSFWQWVQSLKNAKLTISAWDDPLPFLMGLWRMVIQSVEAIKNKLFNHPAAS